MRSLLIVFFTLFSLTAVAQSSAADKDAETARLNSWLDAAYDEELTFSPMSLTRLGRMDLYDQIDNYSEAALDAKYNWREKSVADIKKEFQREQLTPEGQISFDFWIFRVERARADLTYRRHNYIFDQMGSQQTEFPRFLINDHNVSSEADMLAYIARIEGSARAMEQLLKRAQMAAKEGIRPPLFAYTVVIDESQKVISGAPFDSNAAIDSALWADAKGKITALSGKDLISTPRAEELRKQTAEALRGRFRQSYLSLIAWMEKDLPNADREPRGVHALPKGQAYYAHKLESYTSGNKSADDVHKIGLAEVARLRAEMKVIIKKTGFDGEFSEFLNYVRDDRRFYYSNDEKGRAEYIAETKRLMDLTRQFLPQYSGLLPKADLVVKRVEAFRERDGGAAHYRKGVPDGSKPGTYYLHLSDMSAMNSVTMQSTAYHEGVPGHHMQQSIALESKALPVFRTNVSYSSYKMGMLNILDMRARARAILGDKFDIRGFHDVLLGGGSLPREILERRVNDWVASQGS